MKKSLDAVLVQQKVKLVLYSSILLAFVMFPPLAQADRFQDVNSPFEKLRLSLFPKEMSQSDQCKIIHRNSTVSGLEKIDGSIATKIDSILKAIQKKNGQALAVHFHPRLKMSALYLTTILDQLAANYGGGDFDLTIYRVWAFNSPEGDSRPVECAADQLSAIPSFGYPLQLGVWLQARGNKELGRIYLNLVPKGKRWYIGIWHHQQWTHDGKDPDIWIDQALIDGEKGRTELAYAKLDLAHKLLKGGKYLRLQKLLDAEATRSTYGSPEKWRKQLKLALKDYKVGYAGTAMAEDGIGILVRLVVDPNLPTNDLRAKCLKAGKLLYEQSWTKGFGGFQCSFVAASEDPSKEGRLGGYFYPRASF